MTRWYDVTVEVRVYLDDGAERTDEDVELAVQGALDDAAEAFTELLDGVSLSVQGIDLGELRGDE